MSELQLRDALADFAAGRIETGENDFGEKNCRAVLEAAGIATTTAEFENAARTFRQMPFYGGSYTLDARRILKAIATTPTERHDHE